MNLPKISLAKYHIKTIIDENPLQPIGVVHNNDQLIKVANPQQGIIDVKESIEMVRLGVGKTTPTNRFYNVAELKQICSKLGIKCGINSKKDHMVQEILNKIG